METSTGIFDKNGTEIAVGQRVRESFVIHTKDGDYESSEVTIGFINYERGCHVIDFGPKGVYPLFSRYPTTGRIQDRVWEVLP